MGIVRLLLALAVVGAHINSHSLLKFVGGEVAVQGFFVISGFYMAMIVSSYETKKDFWISRYLRLYPVYIVCALASLFGTLFLLGIQGYISKAESLPISAILFLTFTNFTMFFQDIVMFLGVNNGTLSFVKNFTESTPPLYQFLLIPQGWSLGIELSFYILAPFLLNKSIRTIIVVLILSELIRITLIGLNYSNDPWSYRFFPSELSTFLMGSLAYKFYKTDKEKGHKNRNSVLIFTFVLIFIISFTFISIEYETKKIFFIIFLAFSIGDIFSVTENLKIDKFIGMLSYPIYISHLLMINICKKINLLSSDGTLSTTVLIYAWVIGFSMILYFFIEKPANLFRHRFKKKPNV